MDCVEAAEKIAFGLSRESLKEGALLRRTVELPTLFEVANIVCIPEREPKERKDRKERKERKDRKDRKDRKRGSSLIETPWLEGDR